MVSFVITNVNKTKLPVTEGFTIARCRLWKMDHASCFTARTTLIEIVPRPTRKYHENARASGEAPRGRGKESLQRFLIKFDLYFAHTKGNTIYWKMTFRKSNLIDNRPSWRRLRLYVKFGFRGDQIGTENLFQPSKQTDSFDVILPKKKFSTSQG